MKFNKILVYIALTCMSTLCTRAQNVGVNPRNDAGAVELAAHEQAIVEAARSAAVRDDDTTCIAELVRPAAAHAGIGDSLAALRRTASVCALLANENQYPAAKRVARLGLAYVASAQEATPESRVERGYWEAWLQLEILDSPAVAIATLRTAARIAPDDERLLALQKRADSAMTREHR